MRYVAWMMMVMGVVLSSHSLNSSEELSPPKFQRSKSSFNLSQGQGSKPVAKLNYMLAYTTKYYDAERNFKLQFHQFNEEELIARLTELITKNTAPEQTPETSRFRIYLSIDDFYQWAHKNVLCLDINRLEGEIRFNVTLKQLQTQRGEQTQNNDLTIAYITSVHNAFYDPNARGLGEQEQQNCKNINQQWQYLYQNVVIPAIKSSVHYQQNVQIIVNRYLTTKAEEKLKPLQTIQSNIDDTDALTSSHHPTRTLSLAP